MVSPRTTSWLPIAGLLVGVAGALGWLLLGFASDRTGMEALPNPQSKVEFLVPQAARLTFAEVVSRPVSAWKRRPNGRHDMIGAVGAELWVRVTLRNPGDTPLRGVLADGDFFADRVEAWVGDDSQVAPEAGAPAATASGTWRELLSGEAVPMKEKALWGREIAFPVTVPAKGERVIYLRADDALFTSLQPLWWPRQADFHAMQVRSQLGEGLYLGGLLALLGYNVVLWLRLRLPDIRCYVLYLGTVAVFAVLARSHESTLGWALGSPGLEILLTVAMALNGVFLTEFARVFLDLPGRSRWVDRLTRGLQAVMLGLAAAALASWWWTSLRVLGPVVLAVGVTHVALLGVALWAWRDGVRQARFFVLSFGCLFAGSLPMVGVWLSEAMLKHTAMMGLMVGSALEMLLLSLAVADRFVQAQQEKAAAQEKLVEETEQRRSIEEAYADELELEVRERTRELENANADKDRMLTVIGHDLRGPLAGLTQSAEQLTAGPVAHAANAGKEGNAENAVTAERERAERERAALEGFASDAAKLGRQVLLLIEDLVLWARLRTGAAHPPARHQVRAVVAPVIALHRAIAGQRRIALVVTVPNDLRVATDLVLAQTLLRNLVANALKFARSQVVVSATRAEVTGGGVRLTVRDDGPGLPAAVQAHFRASDGDADAVGASVGVEGGLGLRLCREISRALGAKLEASVGAGGGTEFAFVLPAAGGETGEEATGGKS